MDSINDIFKSLKSIFENEARILSLKGIEKSSVLLGLLATILVISAFGIMFLIFATIALAGYLNSLLGSNFYGFLIVSGIDLLAIGLMLLIMIRRKTPLFTNLFIRKLISIFNITNDED